MSDEALHSEQHPDGAPSRWTLFAACAGLVLLVAAIYARTAGFDFVLLDDDLVIYDSDHVMGGLTWTNAAWAFAFGKATYWHPLTYLSFMLDASLFGATPGGIHVENALFHAANAVLFFFFLFRTTRRLAPAWIAAALFAAHPLHVESVAWAVERKDVLYAFFWLLCIHAYTGYARATDPGSRLSRMAVACCCLLLSLMAKPMAVTAPFLFLLLDVWPLRRWAPLSEYGFRLPPARLILEKLPMLAIVAGVIVISFLAKATVGIGSADTATAGAPFSAFLANALVSYFEYIRHMLWPTGLAVIYPFDAHLPLWQPMGAALGLAAASGAVLWQLKPRPWLAVGWFWFLGTLLPVIGIVQSGLLPAWADRFSYFPLLGLYAALACTTHTLWGRSPYKSVRMAHVATWAAIVLLLAGWAWRQTGFWKDSEAMLTRALAVTTGHAVIWNNMGMILVEQHRDTEAISYLEQSIEQDPNYHLPYTNLGFVLLGQGELDKAEKLFLSSRALYPGFGRNYSGMAQVMLERSEPAEALAWAKQGLSANPDSADLLLVKGRALEGLGRWAEAEDVYRLAAELEPEAGSPLFHLGALEERYRHNPEKAEVLYRKALDLEPELAEPHYNLALLLAARGEEEEAEQHYREAARLAPRMNEAPYNLGNLLFRQGRLQEALKSYGDAEDRARDKFAARLNKAVCLARLERANEAVAVLRTALRDIAADDPRGERAKVMLQALGAEPNGEQAP